MPRYPHACAAVAVVGAKYVSPKRHDAAERGADKERPIPVADVDHDLAAATSAPPAPSAHLSGSGNNRFACESVVGGNGRRGSEALTGHPPSEEQRRALAPRNYKIEHASLNGKRGSRGCSALGSPYPRLQRKFDLTCPSGKNS